MALEDLHAGFFAIKDHRDIAHMLTRVEVAEDEARVVAVERRLPLVARGEIFIFEEHVKLMCHATRIATKASGAA